MRKVLPTVAWFLIKFNLLALPMYAVIISGVSYGPFQTLVAQMSNAVLSLLGFATTQVGATIKTSVTDVYISWDSTAWKSLYAMAALILATPLNLNLKARFVVIALPAIFIVNILRIVTTVGVTLSYGIQYFNFLHLFLWREGLIATVVVLWAVWLWREKHNITKDEGIFRWVLGKG